jgi:hypothetical protein
LHTEWIPVIKKSIPTIGAPQVPSPSPALDREIGDDCSQSAEVLDPVNKSQIDHAERLLGVALPDAYRQFLERLPDPGPTRGWQGAPTFEIYNTLHLINHAEGLAVENRQLRYEGRAAFAGEPWPDRYVAIGNDGCGNIYCLDVGTDPSPALMMFDHDPEDDFVETEPSYAAFFASLEIPEPTTDQRGGSDEGLDDSDAEPALILARVAEPWQSILDPIRLVAWRAYIESDPTLKFIGDREMRNPFTGEAIVIRVPGLADAVWEPSRGRTVPIEYHFGRLTMEGDHPGGLETMKRIARALNARLFDAQGRELDLSVATER